MEITISRWRERFQDIAVVYNLEFVLKGVNVVIGNSIDVASMSTKIAFRDEDIC